MENNTVYKKPLYEVAKIRDLKEMLQQSSILFGGKAAFLIKRKGEDSYVPITYSQYKQDVDAFGTVLVDCSLKGEKIAVIGENRYEWAVTYMAVVTGTGVIVPIDKELPENEIESLLERSEASAVVFSGKHSEIIKRIAEKNPKLKYLIDMDITEKQGNILAFTEMIKKGRELINDNDKRFLEAEIDPDVMNILLFTSGTTADSKAVMLSHTNICSDLMGMCAMTYIGPKDIFLSVLPLHHTYECTCGFLCQIYRGCTIAYCEGLRHIAKNMKEVKATMMLSVPLILESIYKHIWEQISKDKGTYTKVVIALRISNLLRNFGIDIREKLFKQINQSFGGNLRLLISGAAGINPKVAKGFRDLGIDLIQGYGLTECAPIVALNRDIYYKDSAAGLRLPGVEVKIDQRLEDGSGEIIAKGPNVMLGYYKNQEATDKAIVDGWFHTGDLGYIDKDGFVYVTGREKDVIVTKNGKNIYPEEIEKVLNGSKYIEEAMIWGKPDENGDIIICAIIIPHMDNMKSEFKNDPTEEQIHSIIAKEIKAINSKMPIYRHIKDFSIREEKLIKTTTQKVKRHKEMERMKKTC
ncbi:MAG: AMP-dependent synthetase/ligase [Ignavibacteriales bacterium]